MNSTTRASVAIVGKMQPQQATTEYATVMSKKSVTLSPPQESYTYWNFFASHCRIEYEKSWLPSASSALRYSCISALQHQEQKVQTVKKTRFTKYSPVNSRDDMNVNKVPSAARSQLFPFFQGPYWSPNVIERWARLEIPYPAQGGKQSTWGGWQSHHSHLGRCQPFGAKFGLTSVDPDPSLSCLSTCTVHVWKIMCTNRYLYNYIYTLNYIIIIIYIYIYTCVYIYVCVVYAYIYMCMCVRIIAYTNVQWE